MFSINYFQNLSEIRHFLGFLWVIFTSASLIIAYCVMAWKNSHKKYLTRMECFIIGIGLFPVLVVIGCMVVNWMFLLGNKG